MVPNLKVSSFGGNFEKFEVASNVTIIFFKYQRKSNPNKAILVLNLRIRISFSEPKWDVDYIYKIESRDINEIKGLRISTLLWEEIIFIVRW